MNPTNSQEPQIALETKFSGEVTGMFKEQASEVAIRNATIQRNDGFIYGDWIKQHLNIPKGHDITRVNWLRRTVEIHRAQFMGKGFSIDSSYDIIDLSTAMDEEDAKQKMMENDRRKANAALRRQLVEAINRDNGGETLWDESAENASAIGDTVIKAWYDQEAKKYIIQNVESVENVYALWNNDDFRQLDSIAYVYQISVDKAVRLYDLKQDEIVTSPAGQPFGPLGATESPSPVTTSQPMITVIEVTGTIPGWSTDGKGNLITCKLGKERKLNAIVVGTKVVQVIDDEKKLPNYYILPNKRVRRRAWGSPDISESAIEINMTYIETLSDWRTVASKVNFPKFKAFGFSLGTQIPKPQPRKVEILPLGENQDIVPLTQGQSAGLGETDFPRQIEELKDEFVREVGISRQLFDLPDQNGNSNPALLTAMKSVSDITTAKRKLWEPIIRQIFEDALRTIAKFDDDVKQIVETDDNWFIKVSFPSAMNAEDPTFHSMIMNQFNTGILSAQTAVEKLGYDKQEIDQIRAEMEDPLLAAIHAHTLPNFANSKLPQTGPEPPKVNINLRGDLSPEQEGNLAYQRGFNEGPFGTSIAPQGNAGLTAQANEDNQGLIEGNRPTGGIAISRDPEGNPLPNTNGVQPPNGQGVNQPELINGAASQGQGVGIMSQPGTGAPMTTANGKMKQMQQRQGA